MPEPLIRLYVALTTRTRDDERGISVIVEMLLAALALVVVFTAATPVVRDRVVTMIGNVFDSMSDLG